MERDFVRHGRGIVFFFPKNRHRPDQAVKLLRLADVSDEKKVHMSVRLLDEVASEQRIVRILWQVGHSGERDAVHFFQIGKKRF